MKAFLIDVKNNEAKAVETDGGLDSLYKLTDCTCIDIAVRKIGGKWFDIVCDDEGLFRDDIKISAVNRDGEPMLVGNLLFCHHDSHRSNHKKPDRRGQQ